MGVAGSCTAIGLSNSWAAGTYGRVTVWTSIRAVIAPTPITLEPLLAHADSAMYEAKNAGGNRHNIVDL
jgi:GGDEF domain-containing protein